MLSGLVGRPQRRGGGLHLNAGTAQVTNCEFSGNRSTAGDSWANCDGSTAEPTLNVNDFNCFLNQFAAGCT